MGTGEKKEDRRKQRTRRLLRDALMELVIERDYESITIQDIAERANVARTTFYLHFKDKEDLLFNTMAEWYDEMTTHVTAYTRQDLEGKSIAEAFIDPTDYVHVAENADFYRTMFSGKGSAGFIMRVIEYIANGMSKEFLPPLVPNGENRLPLDFLGYYFAGAQIGVLAWWLKNNLPHSPEEMVRMESYLGLFGLKWAAQLDVSPPDSA